MLFFQPRLASLCILAALFAPNGTGRAGAQSQSAEVQIARSVGTIKTVQPNSITLTSDAGIEITATLSSSTRILRVPPGQKDLKNASPLQVQDLQAGDRVLVRGQASADHSVAALSVIVMKQADVSAKHARDRDDWQKRSVGGLVRAVDAATGEITIASGGFGGSRTLTVHTSKQTVARRYAAESVRFDEARPAPLDQIKPGDQLRALGTRSSDGNEVTADEIVSGTFRNIAGAITSIDPASSSITVQDTIGKSAVTIKVSPDSQIKKLPTEFAQRMALRLKATTGEGEESGAVPAPPSGPPAGGAPGTSPRFSRGPAGALGEGGNRAPDMERFLSRLPNSKLSDLQKGDAVMIVSTLGQDSEAVTAITLLAGVEPILSAAPNRSGAVLLSPWTLGASSGEAETVP